MLPLVLSLSPAALVREPFGLQLRRQLVDLVVSNDGSSSHRASSDLDASKDLVVHMIERLSVTCGSDTKLSVHHHDTGTKDVRDATTKLITDCLETASKQLHGNKRIALLVDDFDAPFLENADDTDSVDADASEPVGMDPAFAAGLLQGCADSVKYMRGGAAMFMTGTFRASHSSLSAGLLESHMVDLSLDMLHNSTWGLRPADLSSSAASSTPLVDTVTAATRLGANNMAAPRKEPKRFLWDNTSMQPVRDSTASDFDAQAVGGAGALGSSDTSSSAASLTVDVPLSHSGGYWFGGYDTETGQPEAIFPCRPWGACMDPDRAVQMLGLLSSQPDDKISQGFSQLATGLFHMNPMDRWHASVSVETRPDIARTPNDWSVVLLQAGILTMGARAVRFDEFHSYAWARLGFPNETARLAFAERVVRPVVEIAMCRLSERGPHVDNSAWSTLRSTQHSLSEVLLRPARGGNPQARGQVEKDNACIASLVGHIKAFSRTLSHGLSEEAGKTGRTETNQRLEADVFKILMLCVPYLDVHDRQGDDVSDTGLGQDTFAGSSGSAIMDDLAPKRKGIELVARKRCGVSALPAYAAELDWAAPPVETLHVLDAGLGVRAVVKFV